MLSILFPRTATTDFLKATLRRVPFTLLTVAAILLVTAATGTMTRPITPALLARWGFGLDDLRSGRLYLLVLTPFQVYRPFMVLTITASLLLFLGACEYLLGTRRAVIAFWLTNVTGYLGAFLLLWPFAAAGYGWAGRLAHGPDVGASAAGFGAVGTVIPFLPPAYRRVTFIGLVAYLLALLVAGRHIWDVEHLVAFPVGLLLGMRFLHQRGESLPALAVRPRLSRRQRPAVVAWAVGVMGAVNILSAFVSPRHRALLWLEENLPLGAPLTHTGRHLALVLGVALVLLALSAARGKRQAWRLIVVALGVSALLHLTNPAALPEALLAGGLLLVLIAWRDEFVAPSDPPSRRQGSSALLLLALVLPLYGVAGFFVLRHHYAEPYTAWAALKETGARLLFANAGEYAPQTRRARWFLDSIPVLGWGGLLYALTMLLRGVLAPRPMVSDIAQARRLLAAHGRSLTSYMTLWEGNAIFFGPARAAYIGYRLSAGTALALGDPIGPDDALVPTIEAFAGFCRAQGWEHAFYAATPRALAAYEQLAYRTLKIAEEALIPLPSLAFKGKAWQDVRTALNRAAREGISFQLYEGGAVPSAIREQLIAISAAWLRGQALPELGFTLGKTTDIDDPNVYVAVAADSAGSVQGFVDWLPLYAARGWVIDLMRRRPDACAGVMEFLIGSSLLAFKERGDQVASLAAAPLAHLGRDQEESALARGLGFVYAHFDRFYHFQSLFAFKKKFQPQWQDVYLVYRSHAELPRITLAILHAQMPTLGPRLIGEIIGATIAEPLLAPRTHPAAETATARRQS